MTLALRIQIAIRAASIHLLYSVGVALIGALLVFFVWYPYPYRDLSGGRELFLLVTIVDVICGPLLTLVLFNPSKPRPELWRDLALVVLIQFGALGYGLWTVWQARPLFLVMEIDRFKVVTAVDLRGVSLSELPSSLRPGWITRPIIVAIREPKDKEERQKVLLESIQGGRDYGERPEFYLPYEGSNAIKSLKRARPLTEFLRKQTEQTQAAKTLATIKKTEIAEWLYLPVVARQDWVAVLDKQGQIQGFLKGDGF